MKSPVCRETLNPEWNVTALFYRKKADSLIKIQVDIFLYFALGSFIKIH